MISTICLPRSSAISSCCGSGAALTRGRAARRAGVPAAVRGAKLTTQLLAFSRAQKLKL